MKIKRNDLCTCGSNKKYKKCCLPIKDAKFAAQLREIEKFFMEHPVPSARRTIVQALEIIRTREAWIKRDYDSIAAWLKRENNKSLNLPSEY